LIAFSLESCGKIVIGKPECHPNQALMAENTSIQAKMGHNTRQMVISEKN